MYTNREWNAARRALAKIAHENNVSEAQVRAEILTAMNAGMRDPDPEVQARWAGFRCAGADPTAEELILWLAELTARKMKSP